MHNEPGLNVSFVDIFVAINDKNRKRPGNGIYVSVDKMFLNKFLHILGKLLFPLLINIKSQLQKKTGEDLFDIATLEIKKLCR